MKVIKVAAVGLVLLLSYASSSSAQFARASTLTNAEKIWNDFLATNPTEYEFQGLLRFVDKNGAFQDEDIDQPYLALVVKEATRRGWGEFLRSFLKKIDFDPYSDAIHKSLNWEADPRGNRLDIFDIVITGTKKNSDWAWDLVAKNRLYEDCSIDQSWSNFNEERKMQLWDLMTKSRSCAEDQLVNINGQSTHSNQSLRQGILAELLNRQLRNWQILNIAWSLKGDTKEQGTSSKPDDDWMLSYQHQFLSRLGSYEDMDESILFNVVTLGLEPYASMAQIYKEKIEKRNESQRILIDLMKKKSGDIK